MKTYILIALAFMLFTITCKKDNDHKYSFDGITVRNSQGENAGSIDTTDWRLHDNFTSDEKQLFDTFSFIKFSTLDPTHFISDTSLSIQFYPNPVSYDGFFSINTTNYIFDIVIVDNNFNVLFAQEGNDQGELSLNFEPILSDTYRAYYVIQDSKKKIVGMGHGDIEKE